MAGFEFGLPVGALRAKCVYGGVDYPVKDSYLVSRTGEDGAVKVLILEAGDLFGGEYLAGWHPGYTSANVSRFGNKVDGSGALQLELVPTGAGSLAEAWVGRAAPLVLMDTTEFTFEMELPASDAGGAGSQPFRAICIGTNTPEDSSDPEADTDMFEVIADVSEDGLLYELKQQIGGVLSTLWDGSTYVGTSARDPAANPVSQWRFVVSGKPGSSSATVVVYVKMAASRATLAAATEYQLTDGSAVLTFDTSAWRFHEAFIRYKLETAHLTYFEAGNPFYSTGFTVTYPAGFKVRADYIPAGGEYVGAVQIYDEDGVGGSTKSLWRKVFQPDHSFSGDIVLDNTLIRLQIDEASQYGFELSGWVRVSSTNQWYHTNEYVYATLEDATVLAYLHLLQVRTISPEVSVIRVRLTDTALDDGNAQIDLDITIRRGSPVLEVKFVDVYPMQEVVWSWIGESTLRFGYIGEGKVGQDTTDESASNTAPKDGVLVAFNPGAGEYALFMASLDDPTGGTGDTEASDGGDLIIDAIAQADVLDQIIYMGVTRYAYDLFAEAEDEGTEGTPTPGADVSGKATPLGATNVLNFDAIADKTYWSLVSGTDILAGLYAFIVHAKNYVSAESMKIYAYNQTDSLYRNESGAKVTKALTTSYAYYQVLINVWALDVVGGDDIRVYVEKATNDANPITVDSYLLVPIANGESLPLDLLNNALKTREIYRQVQRV